MLGGLWLGAVFCAAMSGAAEPARAGRIVAPAMVQAQTPAWQQFQPSQWPFDLPPSGDPERGRGGGQQPPATGSDDEERPQAFPHCRMPCIMVTTGEPETTGSAPAASYRSMRSAARASVSDLSGAGPLSWRRADMVPPIDPPSPVAARTWFIVGAILLPAMLLSPGAAMILSLSSLSGFTLGAMALLVDLTWQFQVSIFVAVVATLVMMRVLGRAGGSGGSSSAPQVGGRGPDALVGRVFRLEKPIEGGDGMLITGGTTWRVAAGRDCAAGGWVKVLRTDGTLLIVDPVEMVIL